MVNTVHGAERENITGGQAATGQQLSDEFNGAWYVKYSMGLHQLVTQRRIQTVVYLKLFLQRRQLRKSRENSWWYLYGEQMSIAFNVNDNMSISYTTSEETYDTQEDAKTVVTTDDDVTESIDGFKLLIQWVVCQLKHTTWK